MTILLLFLMIAVMLAIDVARRSKNPLKAPVVSPVEGDTTPVLGQRFFHPAHSWTTIDSAERVTVGVDDFAQSVLGQLTGAKLPELGKTCKQGEVLAVLMRGDKELPQVAPVSGTIVDVNPRLARNPQLVNTSPLDKGWTVKIAPWDLRLELANLMRSGSADRWQTAVRDQFIQWFSGSHDLVFQDGGKIAENVCDNLSTEEWKQLVAEFFPIVSNYRITNQTKD
jgi:glycine cleavage system H protein